MLDTALPDTVEGGLINFEKRRKEYKVLAKIQKLQLTCRHYVLTPKPDILQAFYTHRQLTEDQSYRISRTIEPPADSCPNSPRIRRKLTKRFSSLLLGSEVFSPKMNGDRVSPSGSCSSCEIDEGLIAALCPAEPVTAKDRGSMMEPLTPPSTPVREDAPRCVSSPRSPVSPSLPVYNQQIADLCIIRVSMENTHGNLYKSILLTSQDKSRVVIQRALHKHNIESCKPDDFQLVQLISEGKELTIPDTANVYYAMNTSANFDFVLRRRVKIS